MRRDELRAWLLATSLSTPARFVFIALTLHENGETSTAWPSVNKLARETGFHRSTVMLAIDELEGAGEIVAHRRFGTFSTYELTENQSHHPTGSTTRPVGSDAKPVGLTGKTGRTVRPKGIEGIEGGDNGAEAPPPPANRIDREELRRRREQIIQPARRTAKENR